MSTDEKVDIIIEEVRTMKTYITNELESFNQKMNDISRDIAE